LSTDDVAKAEVTLPQSGHVAGTSMPPDTGESMSDDSKRPPLSHASGTTVTDNLNIETAGPRLAIFSQDQSAGDVQ
jgi:hypothetical protein